MPLLQRVVCICSPLCALCAARRACGSTVGCLWGVCVGAVLLAHPKPLRNRPVWTRRPCTRFHSGRGVCACLPWGAACMCPVGTLHDVFCVFVLFCAFLCVCVCLHLCLYVWHLPCATHSALRVPALRHTRRRRVLGSVGRRSVWLVRTAPLAVLQLGDGAAHIARAEDGREPLRRVMERLACAAVAVR